MNWHRKLYPQFLKRIDQYLIENKPNIWATHFHKHWYLSILALLLMTSLAFIYPLSLDRGLPDVESFFASLTFLSFFWFCYWVYKAVLFNRDFNFGLRKWYDPYLEVFLYAFNILLILLIPILFCFILTYRIGHLENDETFIQDVNEASIGYNYIPLNDISYLEFSSRDEHFSYFISKHSYRLNDSLELKAIEKQFDFTYTPIKQSKQHEIEKKGHLNFISDENRCMQKAQFNSLLYVHPNYMFSLFSNDGNTLEYIEDKHLNEMDLFAHYVLNDSPEYREKMIDKMYAIFKKYGVRFSEAPSVVIQNLNSCAYSDVCLNDIPLKHTAKKHFEEKFAVKNGGPWIYMHCSDKGDISAKFRYIYKCKRLDFDFFDPVYFQFGIVNICLLISFLLFLFNAVHWKNFLFALCFAFLLIPINFIIAEILRSDEFSFLLTYFILIGVGIFYLFKSNSVQYHFLKVVAVVLFTACLPYLLMILHGMLDHYFNFYGSFLFDNYLYAQAEELRELAKAEVSDQKIYKLEHYYYRAKRNLTEGLMIIAHFLGLFVTFAMLPLIKNIFNHFLSLPRNR